MQGIKKSLWLVTVLISGGMFVLGAAIMFLGYLMVQGGLTQPSEVFVSLAVIFGAGGITSGIGLYGFWNSLPKLL